MPFTAPYRKFVKPKTKFRHLRKPRRVKVNKRDVTAPAWVTIQKTQFDFEPGDPWLIVLLRVFTLYPNSWWTQGEVKRCAEAIMLGRLFNVMWTKAFMMGCIERGKNPDFDATSHPKAGNPLWFYRITQKGLWLVAMFE